MTARSADGVEDALGDELMALVQAMYPICRSITGDGVRATLAHVAERLPLSLREVPSGTPVLDWIVPEEWNVTDAYVADASGRRIIDFNVNNLHIVSYSVAVDARMSLDELRPHLHTLPDQPDLIPYRTSYYAKDWGFCLTHRQLEGLEPGDYSVRIDSRLAPGSLTYGEVVVPGRTSDEILVSAHVCHPSLADDNLSGVAVATFAAERLLAGPPPRHTHRFLFAPGTIGAITWLAQHRESMDRIKHGLTLTCLGDAHPLTYKRTVDGNRAVDRAAALALASCALDEYHVIDYFPYGYDERQYNSPGFRVPVGSLMRGRHGRFPEYHTSADDLSFISGSQMAESLHVLESLLAIVDAERPLRSLEPFGEPQLGRRGLYRAIGGTDIPELQMAMLWVLCLADGRHGPIDVAERSGIDIDVIRRTVELLVVHELLDDPIPTHVERH